MGSLGPCLTRARSRGIQEWVASPRQSNFRDRVYALVRQIPRGKVMGYGHVAGALGVAGAARQVGYAMAALPADTDVPWHRVIHSSGTLATKGDPVRALIQKNLLEADGVGFLGEAVPMGNHGWVPPLP